MPVKLSFLSRLFAIVCMSGVSITMCGLIVGTSVMSSVDESSSRDVASQKESLKVAGWLMELGSTFSRAQC
jgi:ABC-type lipoprotein release transport system permease subunit